MQAEVAAASPASWQHSIARFGPSMLLALSRCGGVALQFLLQVVVGALAGAGGLGVLQLFSSWSSMLGEGLARGLPTWAMRVVAIDVQRGQLADAQKNLHWAMKRILSLALVFVCTAGLLALSLDALPGGEYRQVAIAVIVGAPLFALLRLMSEALKGAGGILRAITIENLALPCILMLVCAACWLAGQGMNMKILLAGAASGIGFSLWLAWRAIAERLHSDVGAAEHQPSVGPSQSKSDINTLWANSLLAVAFLQLPFLLMPWFANPEDIGVYAVAHKLVNIATTLLILLAAVFGPAFAMAAAESDKPQLRRLLVRTQVISCAIFLPLCAGLLLAAEPLAQLFNLPAQQLGYYLAILAAGQLINAATGLSGVLLNMAGGAHLELRTLLITITITLLAAPFVGSTHGAQGMAILFSVALAGKNLASYLAALFYLSPERDLL